MIVSHQREMQWKIQSRPMRARENRFFRKLKLLFGGQEQRILRNLRKVASQIPKTEPKKKIELKDKASDLTKRILPDLDTEIEIFAKGAKPNILEAATFSGSTALPGIVAGIDFDAKNRQFLKAVNGKTLKFAKDVNETTLKRLMPKIEAAIRSGGGVEAVRESIQGVFDGTVRGSASRSRLIARTEMVGSSTLGNVEAYRQSGVVAGKQWLTSRDENVRDTHADVDGVIVKLDENFDVGGATLAGPGVLVSGDPGEIINCRCVLLPARLPS